MTELPSHSQETKVTFSGRIGEIIETVQPDGRVFERFRRPPGTRLIIMSSDNKILVTKEFRQETGGYDLRLPGGKVRDNLESYHQLLGSGQDMAETAREAATKEALEETGLIVTDLQLVTVAGAGATVEWDLYYFLCRDFEAHVDGQQLEHGEDIQVTWLSPSEITTAIANGQMSEWRSVGVLTGLVLPGMAS